MFGYSVYRDLKIAGFRIGGRPTRSFRFDSDQSETRARAHGPPKGYREIVGCRTFRLFKRACF